MGINNEDEASGATDISKHKPLFGSPTIIELVNPYYVNSVSVNYEFCG
jgi:hypothetical protein